MRIHYVLALSSLAVSMPLASGIAQSAPVPEPPKWSLSLGVDPTHLNLQTRDPGVDARMVVNLTRSWQAANSRWARQVSLMVGTDAPRKFSTDPYRQCDLCWFNVNRRYAGLTAGLSYDLPRVSRFTPYLKGGTGVYHETYETVPSLSALTPATLPYLWYQSGFSLGANAGLGLKARFGSHEFFMEQVLHAFDVRHFNRGVYPFNIGFRF